MVIYNVSLEDKVVLVTGAAGFIGANLVKRLLNEFDNVKVIGIDSITEYYDVCLKYERLQELSAYGDRFVFIKDSIANKEIVESIFTNYHPQVVVNLAAQAGVRYSITNPDAYIESNLIGFYNILEACRHYGVENFRKDIPQNYDMALLKSPAEAIKDPATFKTGWVVLLLLLVGFFVLEPLGIPVSAIAAVGALILFVVAKRGHAINTGKVLRGAPWQIVIFSLGMYLVVYGLRNAGLTEYLSGVLNVLADNGLWAATLGTGFLTAFLSSIMNNMPTVLVGALSIDGSTASGVIKEAMVYANVIGCDLGPKITPIGSLATLLWLHVLSQKNMTISWGYYFRTGIIMTLPVLFVTLVALALRLSFTL